MVSFFLVLLLTGLYIFLIAPGRQSRKRGADFIGLNYAHRGLHSEDGTVPENSLMAFRCAVRDGYAIELDVRRTKDGEVVVFHDETLRRMTGNRNKVSSLTLEELKALRLNEMGELIPTLREVLAYVDGKVPLLIEFKTGEDRNELCLAAMELLDGYSGKWCMESFDPRIVAWFRRNRPKVWRGQLVASRQEARGEIGKFKAFLLSNVLMNFLGRPNFIAHSKGYVSISVRMCLLMGAAPFVWTITASDDSHWYEYRNLSIIFQHYRPKPRFRKGRKEK